MNIRLTEHGKALVRIMREENNPHTTYYKPNFREYTLIRVDGRGKSLSTEKIMIDVNKYFKVA